VRCRKALWYLSARCDDTLSERQRERLNAHLEKCEGCRREAFYFSEIATAVSRMDTVTVRSDFDLRLRAAIKRAEAKPAPRGFWHRLPLPSLRPIFLVPSLAVAVLVAFGAYQFAESRQVHAEQAAIEAQAELGRMNRDAALGLRSEQEILPPGWTPVDGGLSPEMKQLQDQYLAGRQLPQNYILDTDGLGDPHSTKPEPEYVMPVVRSDQMVRQVSY